MEYNSFYGGRQGASFVIQERYLTIAAMVEQFKMGNSYKTVNYDEYVIIDTENKNDPDNGKIYRRGYDYNNNMGGALYVGQIVGPAGLAPHTEMKTINEVKAIKETEGFEYRRGEGEYTVTNASLVAGKTDAGQYNDTIEWSYCSVRDENSHESTAHIGFKFPYTVIDFTAKSVSAYTSSSAELASRIDDKSHPFYEKWQLQIPKGIKGDALRNLRESTDANGKRILVYDSINYDTKAEGVSTTQTVGFLNDIKSVNITNAGKITIKYSVNPDANFDLKFPSTITLDSASQKLKVTYTDNSTALIGEAINYILETAIPTTGSYRYHLLIRYNVKKGTISYNNKNDWFDLGAVKSDNGILVGTHIDPSTENNLTTKEQRVTYLNNNFPNGSDDGKIITIGTAEENKEFYAYNYGVNPGTWYYLGTIGTSSESIIGVSTQDSNGNPTDVNINSLPADGLWFVIES